ncbi:MAG: hypothetical protein JW993_19710 [Sedimentisphaerales bacterium]|nr:hypothetical protein [Sedimentisphaerales bacterium]
MKSNMIVMTLALAALLYGPSAAQTVSWIPGQSPPGAWTISPSAPGPSDEISFSGPLDVVSYTNDCVAEANLGGSVQISVDTINKIIDVWFQGPAPTICPLIYQPVCGLKGTFGPLTAGDWTLRCQVLNVKIQFTVSGAGGVIYVDQDAIGFPANGTSWLRAYRNLQDGLAAAGPGAEIRVANGFYKPDKGAAQTPGDRAASFDLPHGVLVRGGYAGYGATNPNARNVQVYETVLSGDLNGDDLWGILNRDDNSYHVVTAFGTAKLDGVTIVDGQADSALGAGLYVESGDVVLVHCTFRRNTAIFGGGIAALGSSLYIANCNISGNHARFLGGGLYSHDSSTTLATCLMTGNSAGGHGSGGGSAICNIGGDPAQVRVSNCTLADNIGPGTADGLGADDRVVFNFTVFDSLPLIPTTLFIQNSIIYNKGGDSLIWTNDSANIGASYSIIQGGWPGTANLDVDPLFIERGIRGIEGEWYDADSDYGLEPTSQGIDQGNNSLVQSDQADVDDDGNTAERHPWDLASDDRIQDGQVDAGAYEQSAGGPGPGPGPGPAWQVLTTSDITVNVPYGLTSPITLNGGPYVFQIESNFKAELLLEVKPEPATDGTWTVWFDPDPGYVGPGEVDVYWRVRGENVGLHLLPAGATGVKIAQVTLYVRPAP